MQESWQDILNVILVVAGVFGWGVFLAIAARFVFGAPKKVAFGWFFVGLAISVITCIVIVKERAAFPEPRRGESTMLAMLGGTFSGGWLENHQRLDHLLTAMLAIPIIVMVVGGGYLAFRTVMLNRETDVAEENPEH